MTQCWTSNGHLRLLSYITIHFTLSIAGFGYIANMEIGLHPVNSVIKSCGVS